MSTVRSAISASGSSQGLRIAPLVGYSVPRTALAIGASVTHVYTSDLLAAVKTECGVRIVPADAVVIERAELPEVPAHESYGVAADHRREAMWRLALAEYLDAHPPTPPVDEADVETLAGVIELAAFADGVPAEESYPTALARLMLATGQVAVTR